MEEEVGGRYAVYFDRLDQTMRGTVTALDPGAGRFGFTWCWEHEPELPERRVEINVEPGAVLHLAQGEYDHASRIDRDEARSHREGWEFFLPKLVEAIEEQR